MSHAKKITPLLLVCFGLAATAWAGGSTCSGSSKSASAAAKGSCPYMTEASHAKASAAGPACNGVGKDASASQCGVKAGQVMYSFAVPGVECEHCVNTIQKAAMATKGIHCAHVDMTTKTAYVIADKGMDQKAIAKVIQTAGFKNNYKGTGTAVEAEFTKMMSSGGAAASCCLKKNKEKV